MERTRFPDRAGAYRLTTPPASSEKKSAASPQQVMAMMGDEPRPEPPFLVTMASYVIDFHHRNVCTRCSPDGSCPRLVEASDHLKAWRDRKSGGRAGG
ncbi:hypothetical protein ACIBTW_22385 [Micromonospora parva]|uniref:hypothetical protein n=1 Tax=Micromonospora parva TaxID=1464048 RepID=UPI0037894E09